MSRDRKVMLTLLQACACNTAFLVKRLQMVTRRNDVYHALPGVCKQINCVRQPSVFSDALLDMPAAGPLHLPRREGCQEAAAQASYKQSSRV